MIKNIYLIFSFVLLAACFSAENSNMELDAYVGMTLTQVVEIIGEPNIIEDKTIDANYLPTPVEPPYSKFFPRDELEKGVTITFAKWIVNNRKIEVLIWLKNEYNKLIVFTSKRHQIKKSNIMIKYL